MKEMRGKIGERRGENDGKMGEKGKRGEKRGGK